MTPSTAPIPSKSLRNLSISRQQIERLRRSLDAKPRDLLLFDLATMTGMRLMDLLRLKVGDLYGLSVGEPIPATRSLAYLDQPAIITEALNRTLKKFMPTNGVHSDDYLFQSRKRARPLNLPSASSMISGWFKAAEIKGFNGARGLHKIWQLHYKATVEGSKPAVGKDPIRTLKPIKPSTLQEIVYQQLLEAIIAGHIPPGEQLTLGKIAAQMKISPMPVREALNRLGEAGIVTVQKKKSAVVNTLSKEDLVEIQQIRLNLEAMAVELACRSMDAKTLAYLQLLHQAYHEALRFFGVEQVLRINREFHFAIYSVTGMPRLLHIIKGLWDQISPYYHILLRNKGHLYTEEHAGTHGDLLEGLKQKNEERSVKALRADLTNAAEMILTEFKNHRGLKPSER